VSKSYRKRIRNPADLTQHGSMTDELCHSLASKTADTIAPF
jgi:hypothetical protein